MSAHRPQCAQHPANLTPGPVPACTCHTFTPGPWHTDMRAGDAFVWGPDGWRVGYIARVNLGFSPDEAEQAEREGNARLIAEAPAMYAELARLLADPYLSDPINADRMDPARAILARLRGED